MTYKYSFVFLFIVFVIKIFAVFLTNFDLFGDEAQYWLWSQSLDFGYYSKPPLLAWVLSGFTALFGNSFEAIKLLPFVFYFLTSYVIYLLSFELFKERHLAVISAITFYLIPAVSISSFLLSTDVVLVFFWSLCLLFLLKIRRNDNILNFLLLGIFLGLAFLAKYAALYFLISLLVFLFFDKKTRVIFFKNYFGVLVFLLSFFVVVTPNVIWNMNNGWVTLSHTSDNAALSKISLNFLQGIEFLFVQGLMLGPLIVLVFFINIKKINFDFKTRFLFCFSLPVLLIVFFESVLVRANANWAAVALISFYLLIFNHVYNYSKRVLVINNLVNFLFCVVLFCLIGSTSAFKVFDRINGISSFANYLKNTHLKNQEVLVVEDRLLFANLKYFFRKNEIVILTPHYPKNKIKSHFHLTSPLPSNFNNNFIFIGNFENVDYLINKNQIKFVEKKDVKFRVLPVKIYEVVF